MEVGGSPQTRLDGAAIMRPVVLAQCARCSQLLPPPLWFLLHLARLSSAGDTPVGPPWATGKALRCDGFRSTAAPWAQKTPREPATTTLSAGSTSSNAVLTGERLPFTGLSPEPFSLATSW